MNTFHFWAIVPEIPKIQSIYTTKGIKVKRNTTKELADSPLLGYTYLMQYKIPLQIENEDTIVAGLSLRQLAIMWVWGGAAYGIFRLLEPRTWPQVAAIFAVPIAVIGIIIALVKIAEMTFLPAILNFFRLGLNSKERQWSLWTDSYTEMEIGYVMKHRKKTEQKANVSIESKMSDEVSVKIDKL